MAVDTPNLRTAKLKLTDDGRPATLAELGDARRDLSKNERIKLEKLPPLVWNDIVERYSKEGFAAIDEDDMERFKWVGVYQQRPKDGHFMMRIKIAAGQVSNAQLRSISSVARKYADGIADVSTRQAFQIHWLTIENMPAVMDELGEVGLGVHHNLFGACGDICRNIVSSPLTGLEEAEVIDPTALFTEANTYFSSNPDYADMPRKFKIGIFGHRSGGQCEINCLSLYGTRRSDGRVGYGVMAGGGLSTEPHIAQDLGVFVKPEQAMQVMESVTRIYRDYGYRKSRKHARLKFLVADWGAEKLRAKVEELLGYRLEDAENLQRGIKGYEDHYGVHPQKQDGLFYVGVPVIGGRVTSDQWDAVADIARDYGSGDVRLTVMQSFYIVNIPGEKTGEVVQKLQAIGLPVEVSAIHSGMVACTGIQYCNLAVAETKNRAGDLVTWLDQNVKFTADEHFRVNVNGCPNSCGQHWIADIGLQGCTKKVDGQLVEHFDVFLGGALGSDARFNRRIKRITHQEVGPAIKKLVDYYQGNRQGEETFAQWVERHSDEELEVLF